MSPQFSHIQFHNPVMLTKKKHAPPLLPFFAFSPIDYTEEYGTHSSPQHQLGVASVVAIANKVASSMPSWIFTIFVYRTWCSQVVSHPSTNQAQHCLHSVVKQQLVFQHDLTLCPSPTHTKYLPMQ